MYQRAVKALGCWCNGSTKDLHSFSKDSTSLWSIMENTSTLSKMNERIWGYHPNNEHKKNKKWFITTAPKRVKARWNKKKGEHELSKKGSQEFYLWAD